MRFVSFCGFILLVSSSTEAFSPFVRPVSKILNSKTSLNYASSSIHDASDPYVILNLEPGVDIKEIKKAYRKMALKYHPDANSGTERSEEEKQKANDTFAKVNAAYAFLTGKSKEMPGGDSDQDNKKKTHQRHQKNHQSRHYNFHQQEPHKYRPTTKTSRQKATASSNFDDSYFSHSGDRNNRRECEAQGRPYHPSATTHGYDSNGNTVPRRRKETSVAFGINFNWGGSVADNLSPPPMEISVRKTFSQSHTQDQSSFFKRGETVYIVQGEHSGKCGPITSICSNILKIEVNSTMSIFVEERHVLSKQAYINRKVAESADYPRPTSPSPSPSFSRSNETAVKDFDRSLNSTFIDSLKIKYNISDDKRRVKKYKQSARSKSSEKKVTKKRHKKVEEYSDFINDEGINVLDYHNSDEVNHTSGDTDNLSESSAGVNEGDMVRIVKGPHVGEIGFVIGVYPNIAKLDTKRGNVFIEKESIEILDQKEIFTKIKMDDSVCSKTICANFPGDLSDKVLDSFFENYKTTTLSGVKLERCSYNLEKDADIESAKYAMEDPIQIRYLDNHESGCIANDIGPIPHEPQQDLSYERNNEIFELPTSHHKNLRSSIKLFAIISPKRIAKVALALCFTFIMRRF